MLAIEYLKSIPVLPRRPSNSQLWRWIRDGAIRINGKTPKPTDEVVFPIRQLIFFQKDKRVTMLDDGRYKGSWRRHVGSKSES